MKVKATLQQTLKIVFKPLAFLYWIFFNPGLITWVAKRNWVRVLYALMVSLAVVIVSLRILVPDIIPQDIASQIRFLVLLLLLIIMIPTVLGMFLLVLFRISRNLAFLSQIQRVYGGPVALALGALSVFLLYSLMVFDPSFSPDSNIRVVVVFIVASVGLTSALVAFGWDQLVGFWLDQEAYDRLIGSELEASGNVRPQDVVEGIPSLLWTRVVREYQEEHSDDALIYNPHTKVLSYSHASQIQAFSSAWVGALQDVRLPTILPFVFLQRAELLEGDLDDLRHLLSEHFHHRFALLVLLSDELGLERARRMLDEKLRRVYAYDVIALRREDFQQIIVKKDPQRALRQLILRNVDLITVSPFVTSGPVPDNMFFGREQELREITEHAGTTSYDFSSGHPNVVQRLCQRLVEQLNERQTRRLTVKDVDAVVSDPKFQRDSRDIFWERATVLEKLIPLVMVEDQSCHSVDDVREALARHSVQASFRQVDGALERLVDLRSILRRTPSGYEFAVTAFPKMLSQTTTIRNAIEYQKEVFEEIGDEVEV